MNKKLIISLSIIGVVAAIAIGATYALFSDTETSTGNILVAGTMDLKVDHTWETYNGMTCNTCDLTLISNPTNMVVKKNNVAVTPYPAIFVGTNEPHFIHSAWTAQNDPILSAAGAKWIWESDPTRDEDTRTDVTYTFEKRFDWYGPIVSTDLWFAIGSDNSIKIWLNGFLLAENPMEFGYREGDMLHIPAAVVNSHIVQGENILVFEVKNWALLNPPGTPFLNPAGLIYKFYINGDCAGRFFKEHCMLWRLKDLGQGDVFWNFNDIKPGDYGTNIISLHAYNNDAFACLIDHYIRDYENNCIETEVGDTTCLTGFDQGELSGFLKAFVWVDSNQNNLYDYNPDPLLSETILYGPNAAFTNINTMARIPLTESQTKFIGLAWCAGTQSVNGTTGVISCDGSSMGNIAQTDSFLSSFTVYSEQQRNNPNFNCAGLISDIDKASPQLFQ